MYFDNAIVRFSQTRDSSTSKYHRKEDDFDKQSCNENFSPTTFAPVKTSRSPNLRQFLLIIAIVIVVIIAGSIALSVILSKQDDGNDTTRDHSEHTSTVTAQSTTSVTTVSNTDIWLLWGSWTVCTTTCGSGIQKRYRTCNGNECYGDYVETDTCSLGPCQVYGRWTTWAPWANCDVTCGGGVKSRTRTCSKTNKNDLDCKGAETQQTACSSWDCPDCTQTCTVGTLNAACDTCICEGVVVTGRVLTEDTQYPISNAGLYAASAPTTLLALSDSLGKFILNTSCLTSPLFLSRTGFQDMIVEITKTYQEIVMTKIVLPYMITQPQSKRRIVGESVTFCCSAVATPSVTDYEWFKDTVLLNKSESVLILRNLSLTDQGSYQCRANSPVGAIMSSGAALQIKERSEDFCVDALQQKTLALPDDCIQPNTNTATYEVGECIAKACRENDTGDSSSCQDDIKSCCSIGEANLVSVQCSGYELQIVVVKRCSCSVCISGKLTISGKVTAIDDGAPVKFGEVWVNGTFTGYTSSQGKFNFPVSKLSSKLTINIQDNYFRQFLPTVKVIPINDVISGTLNVEIRMIRTVEPVRIDSTVQNKLIAGASIEDQNISIVQVSIPPNAFYYSNGTQYTGTVQASLTFLDPKNSSQLQSIPGIFQFIDEEGQTGNLASLGVFNIYFTDDLKQSLILDEVIDLYIPSDLDVGNEEIKLWRLNSQTGVWEYVTTGSGRRRRKRQDTAQWVGEIDWSTVSMRDWWNYDMVYAKSNKPCYFKVRLFKDERLTENVPNPMRDIFVDNHFIKNNILTTVWDYFFDPEERCITSICENNNAYISLYYYGRTGHEEMYAGTPVLGSQVLSYNINDQKKVLKIQMSSSGVGPFFEDEINCLESSSKQPHLRYHFQKTAEVFTLLLFFTQTSGSPLTQKILSQRAWFPFRQEGYRVCFLKVRVILEPDTYLSPGQFLKIKATSFGGTNPDITGVVLGIREYHVDNVSNSYCIEYKCSGTIDPIFEESFDYTKVRIELIYPKSDIQCIVSKEADFFTIDKTRHNFQQNGSMNGKYELYAPTDYSTNAGLYYATNPISYDTAASISGKECLSGKTQDITNVNPEVGVGITFSCGNTLYWWNYWWNG